MWIPDPYPTQEYADRSASARREAGAFADGGNGMDSSSDGAACDHLQCARRSQYFDGGVDAVRDSRDAETLSRCFSIFSGRGSGSGGLRRARNTPRSRGDARPHYPPVMLEELTGKTVLLVGYGSIGKEIERMLAAVRCGPDPSRADGTGESARCMRWRNWMLCCRRPRSSC